MSTFSIPTIINSKLPTEKRMDNLENQVLELINRLSYITAHFDSKNVKRLDTNETVIKSADGETYINGPLLQMWDKQDPAVLRLQMGYDPVSGNFLFDLYNKAGVTTVELDSEGNERLKGTLYVQNAVIGIGDAGSLNYDIGTGSYITLKGAYTVTGSTLVFCRTLELGGALYSLERIDFNAGWTYFYGSVWVQGNLDMDGGNVLDVGSCSAVTDHEVRCVNYATV